LATTFRPSFSSVKVPKRQNRRLVCKDFRFRQNNDFAKNKEPEGYLGLLFRGRGVAVSGLANPPALII